MNEESEDARMRALFRRQHRHDPVEVEAGVVGGAVVMDGFGFGHDGVLPALRGLAGAAVLQELGIGDPA